MADSDPEGEAREQIAQTEEAEARDRATGMTSLFDLRMVIGGLLVLYGVILTVMGLFASSDTKAQGRRHQHQPLGGPRHPGRRGGLHRLGPAPSPASQRRPGGRHRPAEGRVGSPLAKGGVMAETRKLYRSRSNRQIAGVCGGLAEYFNMDATLLRVLFIVLAVLGGSGIVLYLAMWIIVPREP